MCVVEAHSSAGVHWARVREAIVVVLEKEAGACIGAAALRLGLRRGWLRETSKAGLIGLVTACKQRVRMKGVKNL